MSPLELEDLRISMFHVYVDHCILLLKNKSFTLKDIKSASVGAMEIVDAVPSLRLAFINHTLSTGYHLADLDYLADV